MLPGFAQNIKAEEWPGKCNYFLLITPFEYYPYNNPEPYTSVIHDTDFNMDTGRYEHIGYVEVPGYYVGVIGAYYWDRNRNEWVLSSALHNSTSTPRHYDGVELPDGCPDLQRNFGPSCPVN